MCYLELRNGISWMQCNNLLRNLLCIASLSLQPKITDCFSFRMRPLFLWTFCGIINCTMPQRLQERNAQSADSTFNILSRISTAVCIPSCESQCVDCVCTSDRFLVSLCPLQGYYHMNIGRQEREKDRESAKREVNWAESYGAQWCAWLPVNWLYSFKVLLRTNGDIYTYREK